MSQAEQVLSFECSRCDEVIIESGFDLPSFDYSAEVHSDGWGVEAVHVKCSTCKKEYLVEISNMFDQFEAEIPAEAGIQVDVSAEVDFPGDDEDYREYLKSYVPDEPGERYRHSLQKLDEMVGAARQLASYPMFHRMLLLQHVAMMEAYLCDRLITLVALEKVRVDLIKGHRSLGDQSYPLAAVASDPALVVQKTTAFLKDQLYHELDAVERLFKAALGASPFPDEQTKGFLKLAMINRHHCVHRDGKDNEGAVVGEVNEPYISEVREKIKGLVAHIERSFATEIAKVRPPPPF